MSFTSGQVLTAAQLNDLDIDSLVVDTTVLVVDKTNNRVGVGTASPSAELEVRGASNPEIRIIASDGTDPALYFGDNTDSVRGGLVFDTSENDFQFRGYNNSTVMTIESDGQVGIGTTSPGALLHVNAGTVNNVATFESTDAGAIISVMDNSTTGSSYVGIRADGNELSLRAGNANRVTIDSGGNVGIKTTNPESTLHLNPGTNLTPDANGVGHIMIDGSGYTSFFTMDASGTWIGGNSASRNVILAVNETNVFEVDTSSAYINTSGGTLIVNNPPTGTGNDAEWASAFGVYVLRRNSSTAAEKENITADLGTYLTADMIDSVVPKMWNRTNAPGYPEIGPIAEDMDAISPFLGRKGSDADGDEILTGIDRNAYLSLLVLAVKDLRTRVATLEAA